MSSINVLNVICQNSVSYFKEILKFEIVFECLSELKNDIEWKLIYVGSAEDDTFDQVLDSVLIGPLQIGSMKFDFEANPPDHTKIPSKDLIGVTAILLTCSYNSQEFFRVGYYLNVTFDNEEMNLNPPENIDLNRVVKNILSDKPRITKFNVEWDCATTIIPSFTNYNEKIQNSDNNNLNNNFINENSNSHMNNVNYRMGSGNIVENNNNSFLNQNQLNSNYNVSNNLSGGFNFNSGNNNFSGINHNFKI